MSGVPDYALEETIDFKFTSRSFSTGVPTTLGGTPVVEIYEDNSLTQITGAETLTADFDGVTGLNNLRVVATAANGFEAGKSYHAVISTGTVGGVSVVGEVVAQFSVQRSPVNWANVTANGTSVDLSATSINLCDTITTYTGNTVQTGDSFARLGAAGAGLTAVPWNASWDTEVQSECNDALVALGLDHLVGASVTGTDVTDNSIIAKLVSASATADWDDFTNTTESLQALRDNELTDILTDTAVIGAAGVGLTEAGGTGDQFTAIPWNASWDAEVESEVNDAIDTAISELSVAAPTATPTLRTGLMLLYMMARNKLVVQTSGTDAIEVYNDAGTKIAAKTITDDGSDYTEAEMA